MGSRKPIIMWMADVLPAPLGPSRPADNNYVIVTFLMLRPTKQRLQLVTDEIARLPQSRSGT